MDSYCVHYNVLSAIVAFDTFPDQSSTYFQQDHQECDDSNPPVTILIRTSSRGSFSETYTDAKNEWVYLTSDNGKVATIKPEN